MLANPEALLARSEDGKRFGVSFLNRSMNHVPQLFGGDPFMANLGPLGETLPDTAAFAISAFPPENPGVANNWLHYLNLTVRAEDVAATRLFYRDADSVWTDSLLPSELFRPVTGAQDEWYFAAVNLNDFTGITPEIGDAQPYMVVAPNGVVAQVYGLFGYDSWGFGIGAGVDVYRHPSSRKAVRQAKTQLTVYPIPNNGVFRIALPAGAQPAETARLLDLNGRVVRDLEAVRAGGALQFNAPGLPGGLYYLEIEIDGKPQRGMVVVE